MDFLKWILVAIAVLIYFGAVAIQARSPRRGLRILGRVLTLVPFAFSVFAFVAGLIGAFRNVPGSWADLFLVVLLIPYFLLATPALYPLASVWLSPRVAWAVPAALLAVSAVLSLFALRATGQSGTGNPHHTKLTPVGKFFGVVRIFHRYFDP